MLNYNFPSNLCVVVFLCSISVLHSMSNANFRDQCLFPDSIHWWQCPYHSYHILHVPSGCLTCTIFCPQSCRFSHISSSSTPTTSLSACLWTGPLVISMAILFYRMTLNFSIFLPIQLFGFHSPTELGFSHISLIYPPWFPHMHFNPCHFSISTFAQNFKP